MDKEDIRLSFRELRDVVGEDLECHEGDWRAPGFRAVAVFRFGVWQSQIKSRLARAPFAVLYRMLFRFIRNFYGIELYYTTEVGRRFRIIHQSGIGVHGFSTIGDDCVIFQNATIGAASLDSPHDAPILGNRVEVGCGAAVLGKITIGDDVRIGPNAVVITSVPANSFVFGNPARVIKRT